jgi:hypothetical protein
MSFSERVNVMSSFESIESMRFFVAVVSWVGSMQQQGKDVELFFNKKQQTWPPKPSSIKSKKPSNSPIQLVLLCHQMLSGTINKLSFDDA